MDIRDAFFNGVYECAEHDDRVLLLTADCGAHGITRFSLDYSRRYINMGVAEQGMVLVAAGLALSGMKVFCVAISPFLVHRAYEQIKIDIAGMRLPVVMVGMGIGAETYRKDGYTHWAENDEQMMMGLGVKVSTPRNGKEAYETAMLGYQSSIPVYVRLGKGEGLA